MNKIINIGIVEDDQSIKNTLSKYFSIIDHIEVQFLAESAEQGCSKLKSLPSTQIILLDIGLPGKDGISAIPDFKRIKQDIDIIIFSSFEEEDKILRALCSGACSYVSKKSGLKSILDTINLVNEGGSYMSPSIAREIVNYFINGKVKKPVIKLKERQQEIIELLVDGKTYAGIAKELYISIDTVRYHIKELYSVLHASNKAEAISSYLKLRG